MSARYRSILYDKTGLLPSNGFPASTWMFGYLFSHLVYNQVWEDPLVDLNALSLTPTHKLVTIASAGCNILSYLSANPAHIVAVDVNRSHLALAELKLKALEHLPSYESFFLFFGDGNSHENLSSYKQFIQPNLSPKTRRYWDDNFLLRRQRFRWFAKGFYNRGLLSNFLSLLNVLAKMTGHDPSRLVNAHSLEEQRIIFDEQIAPLFDNWLTMTFIRSPLSLFALGIPPAQYERFLDASDGHLHALWRNRIERLACDFPIEGNYFAWQVFARRYDIQYRKAIPHYLQPEIYERIYDRARRVDLQWISLLDFLADQPKNSIHRYALMDVQDWMNAEQIGKLWDQIDRTADLHDARVIFRTAGNLAQAARDLPSAAMAGWKYLEAESRRFHEMDGASIYGGFHVYTRKHSASFPIERTSECSVLAEA
jgi:S-adenosylmethionine-diacylglycerol 3-amino-3-carboxypropyl transferase